MEVSSEEYFSREGEKVAYREPPNNDHDAIRDLWHAVVGTNGHGIMERVRRLEERPRAKWLMIKDIIVSGGLIAIIVEKILS